MLEIPVKPNPKVSVIIPCYNYGRYLPETLESVMHQSTSDWECIVVDDGSTDDTKGIVADFIAKESRFKYYYQENKGVSTARNTGISIAKGEFIQFLDADDLLEKRKIECQVEFLEEHHDVEIVYGYANYFLTDQPELRMQGLTPDSPPWMSKISGKGLPVIQELIVRNIMTISSPLLRRRVIDKCGFFIDGMKYCEDYEYWLRSALKGVSFYYLDLNETCVLIRVHEESTSHNRLVMLQGRLSMLESVPQNSCDGLLTASLNTEILKLKFEILFEQMRTGSRLKGFIRLATLSLLNKNIQWFFTSLLALFVGVTRTGIIKSYIYAKLISLRE